MGKLERKLDQDLIDRIDAGWVPSDNKPVKRSKTPRPAYTYRGHRRARHFRDHFKFVRVRGDNWKKPYEEKLKPVKWPRRMWGFFYKFGGRAFWDKMKPQIDAARRASQNRT